MSLTLDFSLLEGLQDGALVVDRNLNILFANKSLLKTCGLDGSKIIGRICHEALGEFRFLCGDQDHENCLHKRVIQTGQSLSFTCQRRMPDGKQKTFQVFTCPLKNDKEEIEHTLRLVREVADQDLVSGSEVTQLLQTESALRETEAQYNYLFHNLSDAVFIMDFQGRFLDSNDMASKRLGYTPEEFLKLTPQDLNSSEFLPFFKDRIKMVLEQGRAVFETAHVAKDGRIIPTEINASVAEYRGQQVIIAVARDISERKKTEQDLAESENRFRELFLNMTNGVAVYEAVGDAEDFIFKDLNPAGLRTSDRVGENVKGQSVKEVFPGIVDMGLFAVLQRVWRTGMGEFFPAAIYHDDKFQAYFQNYVYKLPSGEVVAVYEDITERKKAEEELRKSEKRYFSLYNNSHAIMLVIDPDDGGIVDANPAACSFYGYGREEFLRLKISDLNLLSDSDVRERIDQVMSREEFSFQFLHRLKSGEFRHVEVFTGPIDIGDRMVMFSIIHDVTDQHRAQEEAARRKAEWDKTFDGMADIITIQDLDMRIIRANQAAGDFFNLKPDQLVGEKCSQVFRDSDEPCPGCPLFTSAQDLQNHSQVIHHPKLGKIFQVSSTPIFDEGGDVQHLVHVAKDITEQKQLEDELFQAHKMEAMGTLAGGIAHDFNNILTAILGFIQLAQMDPVDENERQAALEKAMVASFRARDLVSQILVFSRKGGDLLEPVEPHLIIKESLKLLRASIPTTIEIREEIDSECGTVLSDPTRLHQIMVNLCTNALHAMEDQKGVLTVKLSITEITDDDHFADTVVKPGPYILLTICDTGSGMSREIQERIFEPYFTTKEVGKGTGMGLAMVHSIIQRSEGMIRVESTEGVGSTFSIFLPAVAPESLPDERGEEEPTDLFGKESILVVDDEKEIALLLKTGLERFGYRVTHQSSSKAALALFMADPDQFDLVITDQTMPELTGADLAREILACRPDLPIILCTGFSSTLSEEKALEIGIRNYLMKPVGIQQLAGAIRSVLS